MRPKLGVIEGFYGRTWGRSAREQMLPWLSGLGYDAYLYAPKADQHLRRGWTESWPADDRALLRALARHSETLSLEFGVGLSPFAIYENYDGSARQSLRERVLQINDLGGTVLALLFDDMPGACSNLAARQGEIAHDVAHWSAAASLLVCPTYYSDDPVLDKVFGARPDDYLRELGKALPEDCAIFWTGPRVCSESLPLALLPDEAARGARALALWDNYPVNDSRERSQHLYLQPFTGRDADLGRAVDWHFANPMNQAALSLPALASLPLIYGFRPEVQEKILAAAGVTPALHEACLPLAVRSVESLSSTERAELRDLASGDSMAATELREFLAGEYRFDPACLTD